MTTNKTTKTILAVFAVLFLLLWGGSEYMLSVSLQPGRGSDENTSWEKMCNRYPNLKGWKDSLTQIEAIKDTFIYSADHTRLHAYFIHAPKKTDKSAVIVHGYGNNGIEMMMIGYLYSHELKYNILLPDLRYSGLSGGDEFQMGWKDRIDIQQWMEVANTVFGGNTQMVVHGISMGAATTMMVAGEEQPSYVKCFVEDCGYTSVWDEFAGELKNQYHLPAFPLLYTSSWLCKLKYGWSFKEASSLKQVARCKLPMLFIHGDNDDFVPTWMVYPLHKAKPEPKELWIVPDARPQHARSYQHNTEVYTEKVKSFTSKYIK